MKFFEVKFQESGFVMTLKSSKKLKVRDENRAVDPYSFQKDFHIEKE